MSTCQFLPGLFVQRACGRPTNNTCASCWTPICEEHSITGEDGQTFCPKCAPQPEFDEDRVDEHVIDRNHFSLWYWSTRSNYYQHSQSEPAFNAEDLAGFDTEYFGEGDLEAIDSSDDFFDS